MRIIMPAALNVNLKLHYINCDTLSRDVTTFGSEVSSRNGQILPNSFRFDRKSIATSFSEKFIIRSKPGCYGVIFKPVSNNQK